MKKTRRSLRLLITSVYMVLLMLVSLKPINYPWPKSLALEILNNALHIPAYGFLTYLLILIFMFFQGRKVNYGFILMLSLLYGLMIEYIQGYIPGRNSSLLDVGLNLCGTVLVIKAVQHGFIKFKRVKKGKWVLN